jgi:Xaa-Pro aminopeptidase
MDARDDGTDVGETKALSKIMETTRNQREKEANLSSQVTEPTSELEASPRQIANDEHLSSDQRRMKRLLSKALQKANHAVASDTALLIDEAVQYYKAAISTLYQVVGQTSKAEDQEQLQSIISVYENRVEELRPLQAVENSNIVDEKHQTPPELPAEPMNDNKVSSILFTPAEETQTLPRWHNHRPRQAHFLDRFRIRLFIVIIGLVLLAALDKLEKMAFRYYHTDPSKASHGRLNPYCKPDLPLKAIPARLESFQDCSISTLIEDTNLEFLRTARPLKVSEYTSRRNRLAQALVSDGIDAFMVEPGYTLQYYADVNQPDWEVWEPEERPFVMVARPYKMDEGDIVANTSFLVPSFEAERARLLDMPFEEEPDMVTYEEHWNPYATLMDSETFVSFTKRRPKIMVDEEMRDFVSRGLASNGFGVVGLGGEIERVRQIKSDAEIGILQAVNTGTVEAVRAMRKCMEMNLTENDVMQVLDNTIRAAGLDPFFDIVLFDEDASNPHGGTNGEKQLENETMVLIDVGAHLYGYSSDICRSFFGPWLSKPKNDGEFETLSEDMKEKLKVWDIVFDAQTASLYALHENSTAAAVDVAARNVITDASYGEAFTHRVGHGIGIKAHESPYLHKGNVNTTLKAGMTFTSEPGVYLADKFGVRHEDVLLVQASGLPELLTGRRALSPWEP